MRILYIAPNLPYPAISGGTQRTAALLEALVALGDVDCCFLPDSLRDSNNYAVENASIKAITSTNKIRDSWVGKLGAKLPKTLQTFLYSQDMIILTKCVDLLMIMKYMTPQTLYL